MGVIISRKCKECNTENTNEARFCQHCGTEFSVNKKRETQKKNSPDSYTLIAVGFIVALLIVLLILNSNSKILKNKLSAAGQQGQQTAQNGGQPPMEMMQKIQALKDAWNANPASYEANVQLGNAYFDISRFQKATFYYNNANTAKPGQPNVLIDLGVAYFNLNKADSALFFIENALKIQPDHIFGLYNAGIIYYNLNRTDDAVTVWENLIAAHPESREANAAKEFVKQIKNQRIKS